MSNGPYTSHHVPLDPGLSGWNEILPPQPAFAALEGRQVADVAIIGGGFAGLSAARRITQNDPTTENRAG